MTPEVEPPARGWPPLRGVRAAFTFLTRVPVGGFPYAADDWRWSSAHFPLVGAAIGAAMAAVWWACLPLGNAPAVVLSLVASFVLTGGFHEDGLADTADALGGGHDRARILEILKDSRIGSFGGLALVTSVLLRAALLVELGGRAPGALVLVECASRVPPIWLMAAMPYVTDPARSKSGDVRRAGGAQTAVATGWGVVAAVALVQCSALAPLGALAVGGAALIAASACAWRFHRRLGGVTGDLLGATQQISAAAMLAALVAAG